MEWLAIALAGLTLFGLAALLRRRRRRQAADVAEGAPPGEAVKRLRQQTALSELRDMREALAPASHNRIERRRNPPQGSAPKIERRKKGARRSP